MSARRIDQSAFPAPFTAQNQTTRLELPASAVRIRKNGIEFCSNKPLPTWTEMTVMLEAPLTASKLECTGVIVDCQGNRHQGFRVSMVFTDLSQQAQARLQELFISKLA